MTRLDVKVHAHDAVGIDTEISELGGRRNVNVPPGSTAQMRVTGDALGKLKAELDAQRNDVQAHPSNLEGYVEVLDEDYGKRPPGSKLWLEEFDPDDPPKKTEIQEALDQLDIAYDANDDLKDDLIAKVPHQ